MGSKGSPGGANGWLVGLAEKEGRTLPGDLSPWNSAGRNTPENLITDMPDA